MKAVTEEGAEVVAVEEVALFVRWLIRWLRWSPAKSWVLPGNNSHPKRNNPRTPPLMKSGVASSPRIDPNGLSNAQSLLRNLPAQLSLKSARSC